MLNRILFLLFSCLVVCGCSAETASPYPIYEADHAATGTEIYWLDNTRVLFMGFEGGKKPMNEEEQKRIKRAIYIWDTVTNSVTKYRNANEGLCYHNDYIKYVVQFETVNGQNGDKTVTRMAEGRMGQEETYLWDPESRTKEDRVRWVGNRFTCKQVERPPEMYGRVMIPLLPEHGYLDFGVPGEGIEKFDLTGQLILPTGEKIQTSLHRGAMNLNTRYIEYKNAYYGIGYRRPKTDDWKKNNCYLAWWFWPSGESKEDCIPYGPWVEKGTGTLLVIPTKEGRFLKFWTLKRKGSVDVSKESGGYIVTEDGYRQILTGVIDHPTVSSDGCKVAYVYRSDLDAGSLYSKKQRTLKVINLCEKTEGE